MMDSNKNFLICLISILSLTSTFQIINANRTCYACDGINCLRPSLINQNITCDDPLDLCVTIFGGFAVETRGCLSNIPEDLRSKCDNLSNLECDKCQENLCNKYGRKDYLCVECDSNKDKNCANNPENIEPTRCPMPTTLESYCYIDKDSKGNIKRGCSTTARHQKDCLNKQDCYLCLPSDNKVCNAPRLKSVSGGEIKPHSSAGIAKPSAIGGILFVLIVSYLK